MPTFDFERVFVHENQNRKECNEKEPCPHHGTVGRIISMQPFHYLESESYEKEKSDRCPKVMDSQLWGWLDGANT